MEKQNKANKVSENKNNIDSRRSCVFCGNEENLSKYRGKYYCEECYSNLQELWSN